MKLKITVDGKTYEVAVEAEAPATENEGNYPRAYVAQPAPLRVPAAAPSAPPVGAAPPAGGGTVEEAKVCRSPINGIVVKVAAQAGQSIQSGDTLLVLEAMKMETNITAPVAGKIAKVSVNAGDGVQKDQILVEFE